MFEKVRATIQAAPVGLILTQWLTARSELPSTKSACWPPSSSPGSTRWATRFRRTGCSKPDGSSSTPRSASSASSLNGSRCPWPQTSRRRGSGPRVRAAGPARRSGPDRGTSSRAHLRSRAGGARRSRAGRPAEPPDGDRQPVPARRGGVAGPRRQRRLGLHRREGAAGPVPLNAPGRESSRSVCHPELGQVAARGLPLDLDIADLGRARPLAKLADQTLQTGPGALREALDAAVTAVAHPATNAAAADASEDVVAE